MEDNSKQPKTALIMAGGGARGAYEVGVVHYICNELPDKCKTHFHILSGSSIGALNSCFLAAYAHDPKNKTREMVRLWRNLSFGKVFNLNAKQVGRLPLILTGRYSPKKRTQWMGPHPPVQGIFDFSPFEEMVKEVFPWKWITQNILKGYLNTLCVTTTELCSGGTVIFAQTRDKLDSPERTTHNITDVHTTIMPEHALASAAIPFILPTVQIGSTCYCDGGLRQNTPLRPALYYGAEKVVVITLVCKHNIMDYVGKKTCNRNAYPGFGFLLGKVVQSLLNDNIEIDLNRLRGFNKILENGEKAFGSEFLEKFNQVAFTSRKKPMRIVENILLRPSQEMGELARDLISSHNLSFNTVEGRVFETILKVAGLLDSDMISYLLFDPIYINKLIELGMDDAASMREDLINFFS